MNLAGFCGTGCAAGFERICYLLTRVVLITPLESSMLSTALLCVMILKRIFPAALLFCNLGSSVACAVNGDWRRAVYWAASSVCIAAVSL